MKKVNRKLTEEENSGQCLNMSESFSADHNWKDENGLQGFDTFCQRQLTSKSFDKGNKLTLTSVFAICSVFYYYYYFFTKTNEGKMEATSRQT